mmetsp:Transcript_97391/g.208952  ORF Transcript_97391/g.208952 Transcript_97391/m.208952 type:complete len:85 (-) Transcript_97391:9-263(-)
MLYEYITRPTEQLVHNGPRLRCLLEALQPSAVNLRVGKVLVEAMDVPNDLRRRSGHPNPSIKTGIDLCLQEAEGGLYAPASASA